MKRHFLIYIIWLLAMNWGCQNIEDTPPMERNTFVRFYEDFNPVTGVAAESLEDGYLVLANSITEDDTTGFVVRTDHLGRVIWKTPLTAAILTGLHVSNDGYFVLGDSIKLDPQAEEIFDLAIYSTILIKINLDGTVSQQISFADPDTTKRTDIKSNAITRNSNGEILILGTSRKPTLLAKDRPYLIALDALSLDTLWVQSYDVLERDYVNAKGLHTTSDGHIIWASAILREQQNFERSYLSIPYVLENSTFENNDVYGSTTDQRLVVADFQPSQIPGYGYGVIGTFATPAGDGSNIFFARVSPDGNFIPGTEKFFDGESGLSDPIVTSNYSESEDQGNAITATQDGGYVLAGCMETTPARGNGGKDIFLIKLDTHGNVAWNRTYGGVNDEVVASIRETPDGGLLICGTMDASGWPVMFLMKTDRNGELLE